MDSWHALVIEDENDSAEVVARILRFHNIPFEVANSAESALVMMQSTMPTVMIVDLALPEMDGWGLLNVVRSNPETAHIPAVAVTAFHSTNVAQKAIEAGFNAYFPKPIEPTSFVRELERILGN
jgi:CheY-like chemotaxis protein